MYQIPQRASPYLPGKYAPFLDIRRPYVPPPPPPPVIDPGITLPWAYTWNRSWLGWEPWSLIDWEDYQWVCYVSGDGNDHNDGMTLATPVKTIAKAAELWLAAGAPDLSCIALRGMYEYKEYLSRVDTGFQYADSSTVTNTSGDLDGKGGSPNRFFDIRTWIDDVKLGYMAKLKGSGIPKDYKGHDDHPSLPMIFGALRLHDFRFIDLQVSDSVGGGVTLGLGDDFSGACQNVWIINCILDHCYGDGAIINRGSTTCHYINCIAAFNLDTYNPNHASGMKLASNDHSEMYGIIAIGNGDDGVDGLSSQWNYFHKVAGIANGYMFPEGTHGADANWMANALDLSGRQKAVGPGGVGNGNGVKLGGGATGKGGEIMTFSFSYGLYNAAQGFTNNGGRGYVGFNSLSVGNEKNGFHFRDIAWLANNLAVNDGLHPAYLDGRDAFAYSRKNAWANGTLNGNPRCLDGFPQAKASDFKSLELGNSKFGQLKTTSLLYGPKGFSTRSQWKNLSGWEDIVMPDIVPTLGAQAQ